MKEPYIEDLASHNGRESCGDSHESFVEALTAVRTGPAIELRNTHQDADPLCVVEVYMVPSVKREFGIDPAESKNCGMCGTFLRENRETPWTPDEVLSFGRDGQAKNIRSDPCWVGRGRNQGIIVNPSSFAAFAKRSSAVAKMISSPWARLLATSAVASWIESAPRKI